ncbi:ATP-binding response regulator [Roseateles sp.]|uniref:ATP-binding response regulator n=1 Tax=Roseateles sp. TaxID=1971397 RepID=UPI002E032497|nr:ATP-binding protein [Roseateles sp.]
MKLRTAAFFVIAWVHLACAGAADLDWARWSAERWHAAFHDLPGEIESLKASAARAHEAGDGAGFGLATGWLLRLTSEFGEPDAEAAAAAVKQALAATGAGAAQEPARFSLLLGAARHQIRMRDAAAVQALLDEAGRIAAALGQPAMRAEVAALRATFLVYEADGPAGEAAAEEALALSTDPLLREHVFMGPQFIGRVQTLHDAKGAQPLLQELDRHIAAAPPDLPYLAYLLGLDKVYVLRRVRQPEAAQRLLEELAAKGQAVPGFRVPHGARLLGANLYRDMRQWPACVEALQPLLASTPSVMARIDVDLSLAVCHAGMGSRAALADIEALDKALPAIESSPAMTEVVLSAQSTAYELLGDFPAAYRKAKATRAATLQRVAKTNAAQRERLQTRFEVAAKDRENLLLKAQQEVLERRRVELSVAAAALGLALVVVAELLRRRSRQRRRLAQLSLALERSNGELTAANGQLQALNASRTRLVAAACHDLRQPAHALGMLAEIAADKAAGEAQATIEQIRRCSASLSDLLDMLFDLSRLEADRYVPVIASVPLAEILADLRVHFMLAAMRKGLRFEVETSDAIVRSDPHLLRRILMNLTSNAVKYTVAGHVALRVVREGREVLVIVEDSGTGIPADQRDSVFSEYVRLDRSDRVDGLGIGLAIVKRSADLLGHSLTLWSEPGQGTRFTLRLPCSEAVPERPEPAAGGQGAGRVVAVIEDDEQVRGAMAELLRNHGYVVHAAADGDALRRSLAEAGCTLPDALVSDFHLGLEDGLQLVARLREEDAAWAGVPTLLITGNLDTELSGRSVAMGVAIAHKPVPPRRLLAAVSRLLDGPPGAAQPSDLSSSASSGSMSSSGAAADASSSPG